MKRAFTFLSFAVAVAMLAGCRKTPDYLPVPYACLCGNVTWQGMAINLLDANYILTDSTVAESRRYYITADVIVQGEFDTHGLNTIIEIPDLDGGGTFYLDEEDGEFEFAALIEEFNVNDPLDTLRQFAPKEGLVQVIAAPISGGTETVNFQMVLNELENGVAVGADIIYSGSFSVYIND
ncbi:MAG: lipoprotein [Flavobacteriales bacterium]